MRKRKSKSRFKTRKEGDERTSRKVDSGVVASSKIFATGIDSKKMLSCGTRI